MQISSFYAYYDLLNSQKDYKEEVALIIDQYGELRDIPIKKVLDVGCGTGNHTACLADYGYQVVGIDIDESMIEVAKTKFSGETGDALFYCAEISEVEVYDFELVISFFNVVNYIPTIGKLIQLFSSISEKMLTGGIYALDCWNGVAAIRDLPANKKVSFTSGNYVVEGSVNSRTNIMRQEAELYYDITVTKEKQTERWQHRMTHYIWTIKCITDVLTMCGLRVRKVYPFMNTHRTATEFDWKIWLLCQKI